MTNATVAKETTYLEAISQALDEEMAARVRKHRAERPGQWETLEIPIGIASHIRQIGTDVVILDCITLLVSNLVMQFVRDDLVEERPFMLAVQKEINELAYVLRQQSRDWFIVSNEVGLGLVPPYQMGRVYRDALGWANQRLAREEMARLNERAFQDHVQRSLARFPFYAERVRSHRGSLPAAGEPVRAEELPVWTRHDQREFFAQQARPHDSMFAHQTSGSTSLPIRFHITRESW